MDDLPCTDEVKVYHDEGEEVEEQVKSSDNLTEDKVGLVIESEGQIPRLFDLLTNKSNLINDPGLVQNSSNTNLFQLPMFQSNPRLASCLLPGYPAAIAAVMASLHAARQQQASMNDTNNSSQENGGGGGSSSIGSNSFSIWSASTSNSENTSSLFQDFQQTFGNHQNPISPLNGHGQGINNNANDLFGLSPTGSCLSTSHHSQRSRSPFDRSSNLNKFQGLMANIGSGYCLSQSGNQRKDWPYNMNNPRLNYDQNSNGSRLGLNAPLSNGNSLYAACAAAMAAISSTWGQKSAQADLNTAKPNCGPMKRGRKKQSRGHNLEPNSPFQGQAGLHSPQRRRPSSKGTNSSNHSSPFSSSMLPSRFLALSSSSNGLMTLPNTPDSSHSISGWPTNPASTRQFDNILNALDELKPMTSTLQRVIKLVKKSNITKILAERIQSMKNFDDSHSADYTRLDQDRDLLWLRMRAKYSKFKFTTFSDDLYVPDTPHPSLTRPNRPKSSNAIIYKSRGKRASVNHGTMNDFVQSDNPENHFKMDDQPLNLIQNAPQLASQQRSHPNQLPLSDVMQNPFSFEHSKILGGYNSSSKIPPPPFYSNFSSSFSQKGNIRANPYTVNHMTQFMDQTTSGQQQAQGSSSRKFNSYTSSGNSSQTKQHRLKNYSEDSLFPSGPQITTPRLMNHPGTELTGGSMKKCRARFGLEHQNLWCKPCRRKKKCIRFISEQDLEQQENKQRASANDGKSSQFYMNDLIRRQQNVGKPRVKKNQANLNPINPICTSTLDNSNFLTSAAAAFLRNSNPGQTNAPMDYPLFNHCNTPSTGNNLLSQPVDGNQTSPSIGSMMAAMFARNDHGQMQNSNNSLLGNGQSTQFQLPIASQELLFNSSDLTSIEMKRRKLNNVFPNFIDDLGDNAAGTLSKLVAQ